MVRRPLTTGLLTAGLALALPAFASAEGDPLFAATSRCEGCPALVLTVEGDETRHEWVLDAVGARGFAVSGLHRPSLRALEAALADFFADDRLKRFEGAAIWIAAPIVEAGGRPAIAGSDRRHRGAGLAGLPIEGLVDAVAAAVPARVTLVVEPMAGTAAIGAIETEIALEPGESRTVVVLGEGDGEAALAAIGGGERAGAALAERMPAGTRVDVLAAAVADQAAAAPSGDGEESRRIIGDLLDLATERAARRAEALADAEREDTIDAYLAFRANHCGEDAAVPECAAAAAAVEAKRRAIETATRRCHELAGDPHDPKAGDVVTQDDDFAPLAPEAREACALALSAAPEDPRLLHQTGRALFALGDPAYAEHYERAAAQGSTVSRYRLAEALVYGGTKTQARRGMRMLEEMARSGFAPAQHFLGVVLYYSEGDAVGASRWLERAAQAIPFAAVDLAAIDVERFSDDAGGLRAVLDRLQSARRRGLTPKQRRTADEIEEKAQKRLTVLTQQDSVAICRELLTRDVGEMYGVMHLDAGDLFSRTRVSDLLDSYQRDVLSRMQVDEINENCLAAWNERKLSPEERSRFATAAYLANELGIATLAGGKQELSKLLLEAGDPDTGEAGGQFILGRIKVKVAQKNWNKGDPSRIATQYDQGVQLLQRAHEGGSDEATLALASEHLREEVVRGARFRPDYDEGRSLLFSLDQRIPAVCAALVRYKFDREGRCAEPLLQSSSFRTRR
ncbi:MAG: hypothetical protein ACFBWO_18900 [Paracoccaceae bacterium]